MMSLEDALQQARDNNRDLVQVASSGGVAYCRLRDAKSRALALVQPLIDASRGASPSSSSSSSSSSSPSSAASSSGEGAGDGAASSAAQGKKKREQKVHVFRDVVDAHFCDWRGRKIASELAHGHPIKLQITQFLSPKSASSKMQEMMQSIKHHAEVDKEHEDGLKKTPRPTVGHNSTGIHVSDKELAVTLQPTEPGAVVKHPSANDWAVALRRHEQLCNKSDRKTVGTYAESQTLKPRKIGARTFRVDKYGRRLD
jgi:translation initiation factor IF-3